jgi:hypothetical protein
MPRPVSLKLVIPVIVEPSWLIVQAIFSCPELSADVPAQAPAMLLRLTAEVTEGEDGVVERAQAEARTATMNRLEDHGLMSSLPGAQYSEDRRGAGR